MLDRGLITPKIILNIICHIKSHNCTELRKYEVFLNDNDMTFTRMRASNPRTASVCLSYRER